MWHQSVLFLKISVLKIITKDAESAIHLFEELGFEQRHYKINSNVAEFHRMKDDFFDALYREIYKEYFCFDW